MKPRILITLPKHADRPGRYYEFPIGLALIAGALRKAGHDVICMNPNHHDAPAAEQVARAVKKYDRNVVCTGGFSTHYRIVREALDGARSANKDIVTIAGGSLISSEPEIVSAGLSLSAGVIGEGELTIVEIANALENGATLDSVPGIVAPGPDGYRRSAFRNHIADLDSLPLPDYDGFDIDAYLDLQRPDDRQYLYPVDDPRFMYTVASRACPFSCSFCFPMFGRKIRKRSMDNFFAEVDMLANRYGVNMLGVFDALFDTDMEFLKPFCERISRHNLKWLIQVRVDSLDEERLKMLKDAGVFAVLYGLESASDRILKQMKKATRVSQIESALALSRKMGVRIMGEFIFGHPAETWETAMETLEWWKKNNRYQIDMGHVYPFPGCEDYRHCLEKGLINDPLEYIEGGCRVINMTSMSDDEYKRVFDAVSDCGHNHGAFGEILSIKKEGPDETKSEMAFTINAACPHCGAESAFRRYHIATFAGTIKYPYSATTVSCLSCNQAFSLRNDDIYLKCPDSSVKNSFRKSIAKPR